MNAPIVLVTGGSRGIGAATALLAAQRGFSVAISYVRQAEAADAVVRRIESEGGRAIAVQADVGDSEQIAALYDEVDARLGRISALVNNAGIVDISARLDEMSVERIERMMRVNVVGAFVCAREAVTRMSTRHGGTGGVIVNLSSAAARIGSPGQYIDYAASKGAIDTLTTGLAKEVAEEGIRVNGVRPGLIDTEIHASGGDRDRAHRLAPTVPMKRIGTAQEIAHAVVWLMSPEAGYVTGATIDVTGGR